MIVSITSHLIVEGLKLTIKRTEIEPKKRLEIKRKIEKSLSKYFRKRRSNWE